MKLIKDLYLLQTGRCMFSNSFWKCNFQAKLRFAEVLSKVISKKIQNA